MMRKFSKLETDYIKALVAGSNDVKNNFPINILDPIFIRHKFDFDANDPRNPHLIFWRKNTGDIDIDVIVDITMSFFELSMLIDYLKKNGLIYTIGFGGNKREWKPNGKASGFIEVDYKLDDKVSAALIDCINNSVFVGQTLKDMVQNDFKSIEELTLDEAKKQTDAANSSLDEAKKQTDAANSSLAEAQQQTQFAQESLTETKKQTKRSSLAVIVAIIGVLVSIALSKCSVTLDKDQELFKKPIHVVDSTMKKVVVDTINSSIVGIKESLNKYGNSIDATAKNLKETLVDIRQHQNDTIVTKNVKASSPRKSQQN